MSHRLKRKLDVSETSQSGSSNGNLLESFVQYGTPLPSLEKKDKNEFVPVWEQTVTDDKGRRRLHGAFTGASAGSCGTSGPLELTDALLQHRRLLSGLLQHCRLSRRLDPEQLRLQPQQPSQACSEGL